MVSDDDDDVPGVLARASRDEVFEISSLLLLVRFSDLFLMRVDEFVVLFVDAGMPWGGGRLSLGITGAAGTLSEVLECRARGRY
jgi:hypothetical protein